MDACPPLEDIAAFLDGTSLSAEERERITEHLARCESCYEIFAGAVHFQEEEASSGEIFAGAVHFQKEEASSAADTGGRGVLAFPLAEEQDERRREESKENPAYRHSSRWLPLAASVVLVVGLGLFTWELLGPPRITLADVIEPIEERASISDVLYEKDAFRSADQHADLDWDRSTFLVGVHLIDLRLSVNAGKVEETQNHLRYLGSAFNAMPGFGDLEKRCTDEVAALSKTDTLERFARELPSLEKEIEQSLREEPFFSFGLWTEAGRLAAVVKSPEFFERRDNRRFLSRVQKDLPVAEVILAVPAPDISGQEDLPVAEVSREQILNDLRAIEGIWEKGDFSESDYQTLADDFQSIIKSIDDYEEPAP